MMKEADLPAGIRSRKLFTEPLQLAGVHVIAVEREELHVAALEGVVALSLHIEGLVEPLVGIVVVAKRRIEIDARLKQRLIRIFEFFLEIGGALTTIKIVPQHDYEIERKYRVEIGQLPGHLVLRRLACSAVANHRKPDGLRLKGEA